VPNGAPGWRDDRAILIGGGCSGDSFTHFRTGLIAQGRDWYHRAAASPDSLTGHPAVAGATGRQSDAACKAAVRVGTGIHGTRVISFPCRLGCL
jgi:hypothetical protein